MKFDVLGRTVENVETGDGTPDWRDVSVLVKWGFDGESQLECYLARRLALGYLSKKMILASSRDAFVDVVGSLFAHGLEEFEKSGQSCSHRTTHTFQLVVDILKLGRKMVDSSDDSCDMLECIMARIFGTVHIVDVGSLWISKDQTIREYAQNILDLLLAWLKGTIVLGQRQSLDNRLGNLLIRLLEVSNQSRASSRTLVWRIMDSYVQSTRDDQANLLAPHLLAGFQSMLPSMNELFAQNTTNTTTFIRTGTYPLALDRETCQRALLTLLHVAQRLKTTLSDEMDGSLSQFSLELERYNETFLAPDGPLRLISFLSEHDQRMFRVLDAMMNLYEWITETVEYVQQTRFRNLGKLMHHYNPHVIMIALVESIGWDVGTLVDWVASDDSVTFLSYLMRYLQFALKSTKEEQSGSGSDDLKRQRLPVEGKRSHLLKTFRYFSQRLRALNRSGAIPFNVNPLLIRLDRLFNAGVDD